MQSLHTNCDQMWQAMCQNEAPVMSLPSDILPVCMRALMSCLMQVSGSFAAFAVTCSSLCILNGQSGLQLLSGRLWPNWLFIITAMQLGCKAPASGRNAERACRRKVYGPLPRKVSRGCTLQQQPQHRRLICNGLLGTLFGG